MFAPPTPRSSTTRIMSGRDQSKGMVRLPLKSAMDLSLRLWQDPAAARSNLIARVEKAFYVPPPPPSKFE